MLTSGERSDTEGIVLRYGIFYGPVPHDELFTRLAKWWAFPAMTGNGIASWVHIDDVMKATADALEQRPRRADLQHRRRPAAVVRRLRARNVRETSPATAVADPRRLVGLVAPYPATAFGTPGCRCPTPRPRPNWAGRPFPGDIRSRVAQHRVLSADTHIEHKGVGDGEHDRRQPRRMDKR